jgi:hypothetical protein
MRTPGLRRALAEVPQVLIRPRDIAVRRNGPPFGEAQQAPHVEEVSDAFHQQQRDQGRQDLEGEEASTAHGGILDPEFTGADENSAVQWSVHSIRQSLWVFEMGRTPFA